MTTERMTDESLAYQRQKIEVEDGAYAWLSINAELDRARRVEQEQAEKIRALEGKLDMTMGERDVAASSVPLLEQSIAAQKHVIGELREQLRIAQEQAALSHDKMVEQVRQARWEVADTALAMLPMYERADYLQRIRDANAPKD